LSLNQQRYIQLRFKDDVISGQTGVGFRRDLVLQIVKQGREFLKNLRRDERVRQVWVSNPPNYYLLSYGYRASIFSVFLFQLLTQPQFFLWELMAFNNKYKPRVFKKVKTST